RRRVPAGAAAPDPAAAPFGEEGLMAREQYQEAIRLFVETAGDDEIAALVKQLGNLGDVASDQADEARRAMQKFADTMESIGRIEAFDKIKRQIQSTESELEQAQQAAQKLFREMAGA